MSDDAPRDVSPALPPAGPPPEPAAAAPDPRPGPGPAPGTAGPAPAGDEPSLAERLSDRLNPILVREVKQATNSRGFAVTLALALTAILTVGLGARAEALDDRGSGWSMLVTTLQCLLPVLLALVPMQAFGSMRQEMVAGTLDQLLLSRLTAAAIVRGKLAAAGVQTLVFTAVFAPLVALTWLLRGVDARTLALTVGLVLVYGLGAVTFAVAGGALCRWHGFRIVATLVVAVGLAVTTLWAVVGAAFALPDVRWMVVRDRGGPPAWLLLTAPVLGGAPLCFLVATAALAHPYENRSSGFRAYALAGALTLLGLVAWEDAGRASGRLGHVVAEVSTALAFATALFPLFAATEPDRLSPRVRAHVPRSPVLAALAVPFLPGGGRGLLYTLLLAAAGVGACLVLPPLLGHAVDDGRTAEAMAAWSYAVIFAAVARGLRVLLGARPVAVARVLAPVVLLVAAAVPSVVDLLTDRPWAGPGPFAVLNPFETVARVRATPGLAAWLGVAAGVAVLVHVGAVVDGVTEVLRASAARRRRAA